MLIKWKVNVPISPFILHILFLKQRPLKNCTLQMYFLMFNSKKEIYSVNIIKKALSNEPLTFIVPNTLLFWEYSEVWLTDYSIWGRQLKMEKLMPIS